MKLNSSDRLHNSDQVYPRSTHTERIGLELAAHRDDGFMISCIMTLAIMIMGSKMRFVGNIFLGGMLEAGASIVSYALLYCFYTDDLLELPSDAMIYTISRLEKIRRRILTFQFVLVKGWFLVYFLLNDKTEIGTLFHKAAIIW